MLQRYKVFYGNDYLLISGSRAWKLFRSLFHLVTAAGGIVKNQKGEWLFIYRNRHWDLPKGKTESTEAPRAAALREVREETALRKIRVKRKVGHTYHVYQQQGKWYLKTTHWFEMYCSDNTPPRPQKEEGIQKVIWVNKQQVKKLYPRLYPALRELISSCL